MSEEKKTGTTATEIVIRKGKTEVTYGEDAVSVSAPLITIQPQMAVTEAYDRINWDEALQRVTARRKGAMK